MNAILINGSPRKDGCTFTALTEIAVTLEKHGIKTEVFHVPSQNMHGCNSCYLCKQTRECVHDDAVNKFASLIEKTDAFVFGSPVYYSGASGSLCSFMDRLFFAHGAKFRGKLGAAIVSARRAGTSAALDRITKYFSISQMPIVSSQYWNMVHGSCPEQVRQDQEGMQTMRVLGDNMAWLLKCIAAGKKAGIDLPEKEERIWTNFIR